MLFAPVTYQYEIGSADPYGWQPIPLTYVTKASDGSAVSSWPLASSAFTQPVDLDRAATSQLSDDGPVQVRALFTDGTNTYATSAATVTINRKADDAPRDRLARVTRELPELRPFQARPYPQQLQLPPERRHHTRPRLVLRPRPGILPRAPAPALLHRLHRPGVSKRPTAGP